MRVASALKVGQTAMLAWLVHGTAMAVPVDQAAVPGLIAPRLLPGTEDLSHCYPTESALERQEGRVMVDVTVASDGSVADIRFPPGTEKWQEQAARCALRHFRFAPGTRDGAPVAATASIPITLGIPGSSGELPRFDVPAIRSDAARLDAVYSDCYPAGLSEIQTPVYKFTVGVDGRARNLKLLQSGGDRRLDRAGECIVRKLQFKPLLRGSQYVKATVTWPVRVAPSPARPPP